MYWVKFIAKAIIINIGNRFFIFRNPIAAIIDITTEMTHNISHTINTVENHIPAVNIDSPHKAIIAINHNAAAIIANIHKIVHNTGLLVFLLVILKFKYNIKIILIYTWYSIAI